VVGHCGQFPLCLVDRSRRIDSRAGVAWEKENGDYLASLYVTRISPIGQNKFYSEIHSKLHTHKALSLHKRSVKIRHICKNKAASLLEK